MWQKILTSIGIEALRRLGSFVVNLIKEYLEKKSQESKEARDEKIKDLELRIQAASLAKDINLIRSLTLELNKLRNKSN